MPHRSHEKNLVLSFVLGLMAVAILSVIPMALSEKGVRHERRLSVLTRSINEQKYEISTIKNLAGTIVGLVGKDPAVSEYLIFKIEQSIVSLNESYSELRKSFARNPDLLNQGIETTDENFLASVGREIDHFVDQVRTIIGEVSETEGPQETLRLLHVLDRDINVQLERLEIQLQRRQQQILTDYQLIQRLSFAIIISVLLMEWFFLFRPLLRKMRAEHENLERTLIEKETANRAKSEFISNMSHEIRTPLAAIAGFTDMVLSHVSLPSDVVSLASSIKRNTKHLDQLLGDVLDLSKVESGNLVIQEEVFDFDVLLNDIFASFSASAREKGLSFTIEYLNPVPRRIFSDEKRVRQVLNNLISNALKFTSKGGISIQVSTAVDKAREWVICAVKDSGTGIGKRDQKHLFNRFYRSDTSLTRDKGGAGIGLSISQDIARVLEGKLILKSSSKDQGSVFEFHFPTQFVGETRLNQFEGSSTRGHDDQKFEVTSPDALAGVNVLLAEDGQDNQYVFNYFLNKAGATVITAENGQIACEICAQRSDELDIVLMDIQMPIMDGYEATRKLRQSGFKKPIIALTAHAMKEEKGRCLSMGFNDYIAKPVEIQFLIRKIQEHLDDFEDRTYSEKVSGGDDAFTTSSAEEDDPDVILSRYHDKSVFHPVIVQFGKNLPSRIRELDDACERNELTKIAQLAHKMKGAASTYGYPMLSELAAQLETHAKDGSHRDAITECLEKVRTTSAAIVKGTKTLVDE